MPQPKQARGQTPGRTAKPAPKAPAKPQKGKHDLTDMQRQFCEHIAAGHPQKEALRLAGSKSKNLDVDASKMLRLPKVAEYLRSLPQQVRAQEAQRARIADAQERQEILTSILRGEDRATFVLGFSTGEDTPTHADKLRAADMLAKMNGEYTLNINLKVTEYAKGWLEDLFTLLDEYLAPDQVDEIAGRIRRFNP